MGLVAVDRSNRLTWAVCSDKAGSGLEKRMVSLRAMPGHVVKIRRDDRCAQNAADYAGFNLAVDGNVQTWPSTRVRPYGRDEALAGPSGSSGDKKA